MEMTRFYKKDHKKLDNLFFYFIFAVRLPNFWASSKAVFLPNYELLTFQVKAI